MMFQLGSLLGIILGYFLCIGHAKLTLYLYNHSPEGRREETDRLNAEWLARTPPATTRHRHRRAASYLPRRRTTVV
jgi:hypothetical protein